MNRKYQVFISSTYRDLVDERFEVMKALLAMGYMPAGMELFPAANDSQFNFIKKVIDESDFYLIILGGKYGTTHSGSGISYTRMEYEYALSIKKPILRFLVKTIENLANNKVENDPKIRKKLDGFRKLLIENNLCRFYEDAKDLAFQVNASLNQLVADYPNAGWVPASQLSLSNQVNKANEIFDYDEIKGQLEKTVTYKMINLRSVDENPEVLYERFIPRLKRKISISSEYISIKVNRFDKLINRFKGRDRTNGIAVEVNSLLPFKLNLEDGDRRANLIEPIIFGPSNVYVTATHFYNGFKLGDMDLGIKADKDTEFVRLIVDFSSIPNFEKMINQAPKLYYNRYKYNAEVGDVENMEDEEMGSYKVLAPGIFFAERVKMKKDEGLRFEFSVDVENLSNIS